MKNTKRKGFNFYRSYYDVFNELKDADKLRFIKALLDKQFLDVEPTNLDGMVNFAWISQYNSIDQQVKGYKSKTKDPMQGGYQGGCVRGAETPALQEEEKEKGKEEEETNSVPLDKPKTLIDFNILLDFINKKTARGFKVINSSLKNKYKARLKDGYTKDDIKNAIENACNDSYHKETNFKYLTPEFFSRATTIDKYSTKSEKTKGKKLDWSNPYPEHRNN